MTKPSELEQHLIDQAGAEDLFEVFFWHRLRADFALGVIARLAPPSPTIVDVGAGVGIFGVHFTRRFPEGKYRFIEPIAALAEKLRRKFSADADWSSNSLSGADGLVLMDVLEHQEDDIALLAELRGKMKPGAFLLITCPAFAWLWSDWDKKVGHYRRYSASTLQAAARKAGFEVLERRYLFPAMVLPGIYRKFSGERAAEFPRLPSAAVNACLYRLGRIGLRFGGWIPFGSSVAVVCRKQK